MRYQKIYGFLLFFLYSLPTFAARTDCISQMALADISGNPITTSVEYEIHFYPTITGGAELTTAASGTVTPSNGILSLQFDCSTVTSNSAVFMEYVINSETLSPRVEMVSAPFAATAFSALSVSGDVTLGSGTSGNYVQSLIAGTGITITGGTGEGSTPTISATVSGLAVDAVTTAEILNSTIATVDLADGSVTSAKILDGTIATADLANSSVTTAKINNDAVTLATKTNGDYVATLTAGTGISTTGASTGENIAHTLSIDQTFSPTWTGTHRFNGNVGIGKAPGVALDIVGDISLTGTVTSGCPAGFVTSSIRNIDFCIEPSSHAAQNWQGAVQSCYTSGARLCRASEITMACTNSADFTGSTFPGSEWIDNLYDDGGAQGAMTINNGGPGHCDTIVGATLASLLPFRCCKTK
ncbi:MAG: hypothetical protein IPJ69_06010 [Deltaproteobacteria bacterium]|nr:MAG: hypothetical protein IPJ69_06010 [Deltaproteobacteria bacterium]